MGRLDLLYGDPLFRGFVGDVFKQASERPDVVPLRVWKPLSNIAQLLERDYVASRPADDPGPSVGSHRSMTG